MEQAQTPMEELSLSEAWSLLRTAPVGRLAVVVDGRPEIFPVNFVVDRGTVVFRTASGTKVLATIGQPVAFEVDGVTAETGKAWSVVIKGTGHEVSRLHESLESLDLPIFPWHSGPKPRIIRVDPEEISGRRFPVTPAPAAADAPPAAMEE